MRVLLVTPNRVLRMHLVSLLPGYAVPFQAVSMEEAIGARDAPLVLLHLPTWDDEESPALLAPLVEAAADVFVICPVAETWPGCATIVDARASDAFPEDPDALIVLAIKARELLRRSRQRRLEIGPLLFEPLRCRLSSRNRSQFLTPGEVQVLGCLYDRSAGPASPPSPARGATAAELAHTLGMEETSVRKHSQHLREKCRALAGDAVLLEHVRGVGYRLRLDAGAEGKAQPPPSRRKNV